MGFFTKEQFLGVLRHVVTFIGGLMVAKGLFDVTTVETLSGLIITVAGLLWSMLAPEKAPMTAESVMATLGPGKVAVIEKVMAAPAATVVVLPSTETKAVERAVDVAVAKAPVRRTDPQYNPEKQPL